MTSLVLATRNPHKVDELRAMLDDLPVELLSLADFPDMPEVVEDGATLEENAVKKAVETARFTGRPALADDTGLEVEALDGAPGVRSARYSGEDANAERNNTKLLAELRDVVGRDRAAAFRCVMALATPGGDPSIVVGTTRGVILEGPRGNRGFGYDPLFLPDGHDRTYAEMGADDKNAVSHRGKAVRLACDLIRALAQGS
jgi:XTP/dITP diphosphohydrolase